MPKLRFKTQLLRLGSRSCEHSTLIYFPNEKKNEAKSSILNLLAKAEIIQRRAIEYICLSIHQTHNFKKLWK